MVQERPVRVERRLSAILAADGLAIRGSCTMMKRLPTQAEALLAETVEPAIANTAAAL